ncbi:MAG: hypothetical protein HZA50_11595 [Planctomycetes bacterium]|nr:hypothetical protein [Planctomycetota bacterium]
MIVYKCKGCKNKLETGDNLSGTTETCPSCGVKNIVPLSKEQLKRQEEFRRKKEDMESRRLQEENAQLEKARAEKENQAAVKSRFEAKKALMLEQETPPNYTGLSIVGIGLIVVGILLCVFSPFMLIEPKTTWAIFGCLLAGGISSIAAGVFLNAFRDLVRNSFYLRFLCKK